MRTIELDWAADGKVEAKWSQGMQPTKTKVFNTRAEAEAFAYKKMGARGCVILNLDLTAEQREALEARKARLAALFA